MARHGLAQEFGQSVPITARRTENHRGDSQGQVERGNPAVWLIALAATGGVLKSSTLRTARPGAASTAMKSSTVSQPVAAVLHFAWQMMRKMGRSGGLQDALLAAVQERTFLVNYPKSRIREARVGNSVSGLLHRFGARPGTWTGYGRTAVASISTLARSSTRATTCTRLIAGKFRPMTSR